MAKYIRDLELRKPEDFVQFMIMDYAKKNGFTMAEWKGAPAYRAGDPLVSGYKYINWEYKNGTLHFEAWMQGPFGGEMDLSGFVAILQKKPFRDSLEQLFVLLRQDVTDFPQQVTETGESIPAQPIQVQTVDNSKSASLGVTFGIISIIFAFCIPIIGICFGALGLERARLSGGSSKADQANTGKVLSIIGVSMSGLGLIGHLILMIMLPAMSAFF